MVLAVAVAAWWGQRWEPPQRRPGLHSQSIVGGWSEKRPSQWIEYW
jgi:hypothetical protein